jgi:hypothetical protein
MSANNGREQRTAPDSLSSAAVTVSRRRLLRRGLAAAPVIMTLASPPVSAGLCTTCSAFGSMHPSGKQASVTCGGRTPAIWSSTPSGHWPISPNNPFKNYFSPALADTNVSLKDVINPSKGYDPVARNCVASLLNASTSPPLTPATILSAGYAKAIWSAYATKGYFEPTAGIQWNSAKIVDWIATTYS